MEDLGLPAKQSHTSSALSLQHYCWNTPRGSLSVMAAPRSVIDWSTHPEANPPTGQPGSQQPTEAQTTSNVASADQGEQPAASRRKRTHRGGKKKRNRRQSFAAPSGDTSTGEPSRSNRDLLDVPSSSTARPQFYRLGQSGGRNLSSTSLDSEALLDHRYCYYNPPAPVLAMKRFADNMAFEGTIRQCVLVEKVGPPRMLSVLVQPHRRTTAIIHLAQHTQTPLFPMRAHIAGHEYTDHIHHPEVKVRKAMK